MATSSSTPPLLLLLLLCYAFIFVTTSAQDTKDPATETDSPPETAPETASETTSEASPGTENNPQDALPPTDPALPPAHLPAGRPQVPHLPVQAGVLPHRGEDGPQERSLHRPHHLPGGCAPCPPFHPHHHILRTCRALRRVAVAGCWLDTLVHCWRTPGLDTCCLV